MLDILKNIFFGIWCIIRWLLAKVPFLQCLFDFKSTAHREAFIKFLVLLGISVSPFLAAPLFSDKQDNNYFLDLIKIPSLDGMILATSLLAPTIYIMIDFFVKAKKGSRSSVQINYYTYKGYLFNFGLAVIIFVITLMTYSAIKTDVVAFEKKFIYQITHDYWVAMLVFSIYCFYLSILHENKDYDFEESRKQTVDFVKKFSERVSDKG